VRRVDWRAAFVFSEAFAIGMLGARDPRVALPLAAGGFSPFDSSFPRQFEEGVCVSSNSGWLAYRALLVKSITNGRYRSN
jgi:hypothetical protein